MAHGLNFSMRDFATPRRMALAAAALVLVLAACEDKAVVEPKATGQSRAAPSPSNLGRSSVNRRTNCKEQLPGKTGCCVDSFAVVVCTDMDDFDAVEPEEIPARAPTNSTTEQE